ncbi:MAG: hypothetical protein FRX49_10060 [Trebouxia sp. A1-2]|nr:MAG: hypothetical protein FRX49_10060 [Trebouxia sp. A1-2]
MTPFFAQPDHMGVFHYVNIVKAFFFFVFFFFFYKREVTTPSASQPTSQQEEAEEEDGVDEAQIWKTSRQLRTNLHVTILGKTGPHGVGVHGK